MPGHLAATPYRVRGLAVPMTTQSIPALNKIPQPDAVSSLGFLGCAVARDHHRVVALVRLERDLLERLEVLLF